MVMTDRLQIKYNAAQRCCAWHVG